MRNATKSADTLIEAGSGNVFVDLGFADAGERKFRVQLAIEVNAILAARKLTQSAVAALFGIAQPRVSDLTNYKLTRFSSERLMRVLPPANSLSKHVRTRKSLRGLAVRATCQVADSGAKCVHTYSQTLRHSHGSDKGKIGRAHV